jgi:hypothetical protein
MPSPFLYFFQLRKNMNYVSEQNLQLQMYVVSILEQYSLEQKSPPSFTEWSSAV